MNNINCIVYSSNDIKKLLGLGRNALYKFLESAYQSQSPFTVIKIGKIYKVPKESFDNWLNHLNG